MTKHSIPRKEVKDMSKHNNKKVTSEEVASKAGKFLQDSKVSKDVKSVSGSALGQAKPNNRKNKKK